MKHKPASGIELVISWVILGTINVIMWWAMVEYVFLPTLHMLGGFFRMAAIR